MASYTEKENIEPFRIEARELVNKGYLAKAIILLEKELNHKDETARNAAFELIKKITFEGRIQSKNEILNLINLI